jgi:hypothetical protein
MIGSHLSLMEILFFRNFQLSLACQVNRQRYWMVAVPVALRYPEPEL